MFKLQFWLPMNSILYPPKPTRTAPILGFQKDPKFLF